MTGVPPPTHPLRAALLKIQRARKHLAELEQLRVDYEATQPIKLIYHYEGPYNPEIPGPRFTMQVTGPPPEFNCIFGDVIHNLRSALDLMANDLVRVNGGSPDDVYFPFCNDADFIDKMIKQRNFHKAGADAVALLKSFAPYKGGNAALRAIHDLDIQDKHQSLIPMPFGGTTPGFRLEVDADGASKLVPLDETYAPRVDLFFPEDSALAKQEVIPTLHKLVELVDGVVQAFTALIEARPKAAGVTPA